MADAIRVIDEINEIKSAQTAQAAIPVTEPEPEVIQLKQEVIQLEKRAELAEQAEDELKKSALELSSKLEETELEKKKLWLEAYLAKRNQRIPKNASDAEVQTFFTYYKDISDKENEWKTPLEINEFSRVERFQLEFVPASLRPWIANVSERMGISSDFAGISSIVTLAGMTGRRAFVYPKKHDKGWKESICLSGAIVGLSGTLKTPTFKAFLNPAMENDAIWYEEFKQRNTEFQSQMKLHKAGKTAEPEKPGPCRCSVMTDATPEALHQNMQDNPEGVLYFRDELSGWLEEFSKEDRESQRGIFLEGMSGDNPYPLDRIGRGKVYATLCVSVLGSFQPNRLELFLNGANNIEDGLVPRFSLLIYPDRRNLTPVDKPEDVIAKQTYRHVVRTLAKLKAKSVQMHFTEAAQAEFDHWYQNIIHRINAEESNTKRSHLSKLVGCLPKVAGLFQLVDIIAAGTSLLQAPEPDVVLGESEMPMAPKPVEPRTGTHFIDLEHLVQAIGFLRYLETHADRVYNSIKSPLARTVAVLARRIKDGSLGMQFGERDIARKHWRGLEYELVPQAIEELHRMHWIRQVAADIIKTGAGRPAGVRWDVNPMLRGGQG